MLAININVGRGVWWKPQCRFFTKTLISCLFMAQTLHAQVTSFSDGW